MIKVEVTFDGSVPAFYDDVHWLSDVTESVVGSVFEEELSQVRVDLWPRTGLQWVTREFNGPHPSLPPSLEFVIEVDHDEMMHDPSKLADQFCVAMDEHLNDRFGKLYFQVTTRCIGATVQYNQPKGN